MLRASFGRTIRKKALDPGRYEDGAEEDGWAAWRGSRGRRGDEGARQ